MIRRLALALTATRARRLGLWALAALLAFCAFARYPQDKLSYAPMRSTRILDRNGELVYERRGLNGGYCRPVGLGEIAEPVVLATLSSEDAHFRYHPGVDPTAVGRALWLNLRAGRVAYGGSTVTQQLAKLIDPEPRTLRGKLVEAYDAARLELTLDKDEILTQYLNRAYYGRLAYGIEAAARRYLGKRARDLTLDEAALLAILPRSPARYDPARNPAEAFRRRAHVLRHMAKRGWVSSEHAAEAAAAPIHLVDPAQQRRAPHLLDYLASEQRIPPGVPAQKLTVDIRLQEQLERQLRAHLDEIRHHGVSQAGIVVLENATGEVLAMVGSRRYDEAELAGAVNVTTSLRPPGSTLKPFVYALALEDGAHPSTLVLDVPTHWRGYQPRALGHRHHGAVPLRDALGSSLNVPAVRAAARLGTDRVARLLHDVGLRSVDPDRPYGLGIALGGTSVPLLELANGYATLARGGEYLPPRFLLDAPRAEPERVLSTESAFLIAHVLADPGSRRREFGLETPLELPFAVAAKTGTSQAFGDNLVVGFTPSITVAVWVGNFDGKPMRGLLAMKGAAPLWREAMLRASAGRPKRDFAPPAGIARVEICLDSGRRATADCARLRKEYVAGRHRLPEGHAARPGGLTDEAREALPGRAARRFGADSSGPPIEILGPPDGATFVIDPLLPRERQRLELRVAVRAAGAESVRWSVDGQPVAEVRRPYVAFWTLEPGQHVLRAETLQGEPLTDEIAFEVEGGTT